MAPRSLSLLILALPAGAAQDAVPRATQAPTAALTLAPTAPCHNVEVGLVFDKFPAETRWEIAKGRKNSVDFPNRAKVVVASPFYDPTLGYAEASEEHVVCLDEGKYTFTIVDRSEDGMCCNNGEGRYALTYQDTGELIATGADFGQYESVTFKVPFDTPPLIDEDGDGIDDRTKNVIPRVMLTPAGTLPTRCEEERWEREFRLHLETDDYGVETTWELRERAEAGAPDGPPDGQVVASGGPYTSDHVYDVLYCLRPGNYTFVFYDWQCDGLTGNDLNGYYTLALDGDEVYHGGTTMDRYWEAVDVEARRPGAMRVYAAETRAVDAGDPVAGGPRLEFTRESGARGARGVGTVVLLTMATGALAWGWH